MLLNGLLWNEFGITSPTSTCEQPGLQCDSSSPDKSNICRGRGSESVPNCSALKKFLWVTYLFMVKLLFDYSLWTDQFPYFRIQPQTIRGSWEWASLENLIKDFSKAFAFGKLTRENRHVIYLSLLGMWHVHLVSYQVNISHTPSFQLNNPYLIVLQQFFSFFEILYSFLLDPIDAF